MTGLPRRSVRGPTNAHPQFALRILRNRFVDIDGSAFAGGVNGIVIDDPVAVVVLAIAHLDRSSRLANALRLPVLADHLARAARSGAVGTDAGQRVGRAVGPI